MCLYPTKRNVSSQWDFDKHWKVYLSFFIRWVMGFAVLTSCSTNGIVTYSNWNSFSDWTRTCHVSRIKLTNSLGKQQIELSTCTVISGLAPWNRCKLIMPASCFLSIFEFGGITKHLLTGPTGNSDFCFPLTSMFLSVVLGNIQGVGGTHCFPWRQSLSAYLGSIFHHPTNNLAPIKRTVTLLIVLTWPQTGEGQRKLSNKIVQTNIFVNDLKSYHNQLWHKQNLTKRFVPHWVKS